MACWAPRPSGAGAVMWCASPERPYPAISPKIVAPRALACSSSSSTRHPAPSPMTKPSRVASKGLLAPSGSSFRVDMAFIAANPAIVRGVTAASVPPASIRSTSPRSMNRAASPMAWALEAHAETVE